MTTEDRELFIRLDEKVDQILKTLESLPKMGERISILEKNDGIKAEQISTVKNEVEKLRNTNTVWSFFNSVAIVIATVLGISIK